MPKQTQFQCSVPDCGRVLATKAGIRHHEQHTHKDELSICPYCAKELKLIGQHMYRVHRASRRGIYPSLYFIVARIMDKNFWLIRAPFVPLVSSRRRRKTNAYPRPTILCASPSPLHLTENTSTASTRSPSPTFNETVDNVADFDAAATSAIFASTPPLVTERSQGLEQTLSLPYFDSEIRNYLKPKIEADIDYMEDFTLCPYDTMPPPNNAELFDSPLPFDRAPISDNSYFFDTSYPDSSYPTPYDRDTPLPSIEPSSPTWTYDSSSVSPTTSSASTPLSSRSPSPSISPHTYNKMNAYSPSPSLNLDDLDINDDEEHLQYTLACIQYTDVYDVCGSAAWL